MSGSDWLVASRIGRLLEIEGLSLKQFAEKLGMPYRTVQNYLTGTVKVPADFIHKSCRYFGVEIDFVFYGGVDIDQTTIHKVVAEIFGPISNRLIVSDGVLQIMGINDGAESSGAAHARKDAVLRSIATALREGYLHHRIAALKSADRAKVHPDDAGEHWWHAERRRLGRQAGPDEA